MEEVDALKKGCQTMTMAFGSRCQATHSKDVLFVIEFSILIVRIVLQATSSTISDTTSDRQGVYHSGGHWKNDDASRLRCAVDRPTTGTSTGATTAV